MVLCQRADLDTTGTMNVTVQSSNLSSLVAKIPSLQLSHSACSALSRRSTRSERRSACRRACSRPGLLHQGHGRRRPWTHRRLWVAAQLRQPVAVADPAPQHGRWPATRRKRRNTQQFRGRRHFQYRRRPAELRPSAGNIHQHRHSQRLGGANERLPALRQQSARLLKQERNSLSSGASSVTSSATTTTAQTATAMVSIGPLSPTQASATAVVLGPAPTVLQAVDDAINQLASDD